MKFEDEVCTAFAFIEAGGTFKGYRALYKGLNTLNPITFSDWQKVVLTYNKLSDYMTDQAIREAQLYVIHNR